MTENLFLFALRKYEASGLFLTCTRPIVAANFKISEPITLIITTPKCRGVDPDPVSLGSVDSEV